MTRSMNHLVLTGSVVEMEDRPRMSSKARLVLVRVKTERSAPSHIRVAEITVAFHNEHALRALRVLRVGDDVAIEGHLYSRRHVHDSGAVYFTNDVICDRFAPLRSERDPEHTAPSAIDDAATGV